MKAHGRILSKRMDAVEAGDAPARRFTHFAGAQRTASAMTWPSVSLFEIMTLEVFPALNWPA